MHLDSVNHDYIIEDLDEQRLVVKENMVGQLKLKLEEVSAAHMATIQGCWVLTVLKRLKETYRPDEPLPDSD